ncbi:MAG TPA: cytochrome c biogenesis protein [Thermoleophilaceae bacterium]|nr:cytochrome c biogenesis protein [Thermoleophilaceae bacterium]
MTGTYSKGFGPLAVATVVSIAAATALVFFYAPLDADQGFIQKIFYVHVPMAIVALGGFVAGGIMAIKHLRTGDRSWDMRSYVAIHQSIILGVGVLITGAIWAKASWGHWWVWDEPVLVSFLVVFLLYCVYYPLRFSIEDPGRQARYSSVFAIAAGAFVPLNFAAVRLAEAYTHPRVLSQTGGSLPGEMRLTFLVSLLAMTLLFVTLWKLELTAKNASMQLKRLRRKLSEREGERRQPEREPAAVA